MSISQNISNIKKNLPAGVRLIAVTKYTSIEEIMEAYKAGQKVFGENKAQELTAKYALLPKEIEWHFIGHLQTNKVRDIAPFISMIHSIDGLKLLAQVNREALKNDRVIDCLLQFHVAKEETKFGLSMNEAKSLLESPEYKEMKNIRICGIMGMASFIEDMEAVRSEFRQLRLMFAELKDAYFSMQPAFQEISMGMSQDYLVAIEEGSTLVRIGTAVFCPA